MAAAALFLSRFQAKQLAYADIASSVLVAIIVAGYVVIARRVHLRNLLVGSMLFFASNCAVFWALDHYYSRLVWLFPAFYIWVKIFGVLVPTQIWTVANYVLTTREAKRVFGMVGGGRSCGLDLLRLLLQNDDPELRHGKPAAGHGGFRSDLRRTGDPDLAQRAGGGWREDVKSKRGRGQNSPRNLHQSMRLVFTTPYLRAIAAVICVSSLVTTLTGWQFLAIAQQTLVRKDALAIFLGNFNFYAGILSLLFQLLFTTRFLRRFGIGTALFMLPATVFMGSAGLLVFGTLAAVTTLKSCDQVLRYSLDQSTRELLYLPLAARVKIQVKWFLDTVVWRLGDGLSGLAVLDFRHPVAHAGTPDQLGCAGAGQRLAGVGCDRAQGICRHPEGKHQPASRGRGAGLHVGAGPFDRRVAGEQSYSVGSQRDSLCPQLV